jgi:hypothetical protein
MELLESLPNRCWWSTLLYWEGVGAHPKDTVTQVCSFFAFSVDIGILLSRGTRSEYRIVYINELALGLKVKAIRQW